MRNANKLFLVVWLGLTFMVSHLFYLIESMELLEKIVLFFIYGSPDHLYGGSIWEKTVLIWLVSERSHESHRFNTSPEADRLILVVWLGLTFKVNHPLFNWTNEPARKIKCYSLLHPLSVQQKVQVGICACQRLRSTWTSMQSDQSLWCTLKAIGNQGSNILQAENQD